MLNSILALLLLGSASAVAPARQEPPAPAAAESRAPAGTSAERPGSSASDWTRYENGAAGFSVLLPGTPTEQVIAGENGTQVRVVSLASGEFAFAVAVATDPSPAASVAETEARLELALARMVSSLGGTAVSRRTLTVDERPAIEAVVETPNGVIVARGIAAGSLVYSLLAGAPKGRGDAPELQRFLDSFELMAADAGR